MATANEKGRTSALKAVVKQWPDGDAIIDALFEDKASPSNDTHARRIPKLGTDLMAREFPPIRWVIPDILPEGLTILAARSKIGKTWLALSLSLAVAYGGHALGKVAVEGGTVLYLGLEDGEARLQRRLKQLLGPDSMPARFHYDDQWERLDQGGVDDLERWLTNHPDARFIVIDTLKRVRPKARSSDSSYDTDYDALRPLQDLAKKYRVAIVVVHHTRKADSDDFMDAISGTVGLPGAGDGAMVLTRARGKPDAALQIGHRDLPEDLKLALQRDGLTGHWILLGDAYEYQLSQERTEIIRTLRQTGVPMAPKAVAEVLNKPYQNVKMLMNRMGRDGDIRPQGDGKYCLSLSDHSDHRDHPSGEEEHSDLGNAGDQGDRGDRSGES
jgi:hypothetical protein